MNKMKTLTVGGITYEITDDNLNKTAVLHTEQNLSVAQKEQARKNIGVDQLIPPVYSYNEGYFLKVVNGVPTWSSLPNAEDGEF